MSRRAFYAAGTFAALVAGVYFLVKMGAAGWFTITFALVLAGVTLLLLWPAIIAGAVAWAAMRLLLWRIRRRAR